MITKEPGLDLQAITFAFLLTHDRVTEGQQAEELVCGWLAGLHSFQQCRVVEPKVLISQRVPRAEIQSQGLLTKSCYIKIKPNTHLKHILTSWPWPKTTKHML